MTKDTLQHLSILAAHIAQKIVEDEGIDIYFKSPADIAVICHNKKYVRINQFDKMLTHLSEYGYFERRGAVYLIADEWRRVLPAKLTSIEELKGGSAGSTLTTKGDIWYGINTMIDGIPFDLRKSGPPMIMITDEYVAKEAFAPDRIYQDKVEGDFISEYLMGPKATQGRKISKWIVSNKILCEATDNTDGDNEDTIDDVGTDSRIMLFVPDPRFVGRVVSRGFGKVGEDSGALGTTTIYGWKGRAYWFDTDVAEFSEAIAWA